MSEEAEMGVGALLVIQIVQRLHNCFSLFSGELIMLTIGSRHEIPRTVKENKCSVQKQSCHSAYTCMISSAFVCCYQGSGDVWSALSLREKTTCVAVLEGFQAL